jgi:hypothetical protein
MKTLLTWISVNGVFFLIRKTVISDGSLILFVSLLLFLMTNFAFSYYFFKSKKGESFFNEYYEKTSNAL